MKKTILLSAMLVSAIAITTTVQAQNEIASNNKTIRSPYEHQTNEIENTKPLRSFMKEFPGVTDDSWIKTKNGFTVSFTLNGIMNHAFLTKTGYCENRIQYYTETQLPTNVRHLVKSTYYDYSISSVKEVRAKNATAYLVTIEDKNVWKVIRVVDGEMDVWEEHTKS